MIGVPPELFLDFIVILNFGLSDLAEKGLNILLVDAALLLDV